MAYGLNNDFLCSACKIDVWYEDNLGNVKNGSGTAFFIKNSNQEFCLLTNRHVIDINYNQPSNKYRDFKLSKVIVHNRRKNKKTGLPTEYNDLEILNIDEFRFSSEDENDIACIKGIEAKTLNCDDRTINFYLEHSWLATKEQLDNDLEIGDWVAFSGFPNWYDKRNKLPILRAGTIASDPRFDYSYSEDYKGKLIAYEAFSYGGSSGSPIFALQKGIKVGEGMTGGNFRELMIVGINAGHLKTPDLVGTHSGISYFYKSTTILELIE